jgi:hypothetical protein
MGKLVQSKKKNISMNLKGTPGPLWTSKNKNHLCRKATMLVYSEFDADSEYIWFFLKNILGKKMTLSVLVLFSGYGPHHKERVACSVLPSITGTKNPICECHFNFTLNIKV